MPWRRTTGAVLAALLLLSAALPAMCGDCFKRPSAESCGEKHGALKHHSDTSKDAKCAACGSETQVAATSAETDSPLANSLHPSSSPQHCTDAAARNYLLADPRFFAGDHVSASRVPPATCSNRVLMRPPARKLVATFTTNAVPLGAPPLAHLSILKI